jgi:hypothetical protein
MIHRFEVFMRSLSLLGNAQLVWLSIAAAQRRRPIGLGLQAWPILRIRWSVASFEESWQVVRSPCCPRELPDVI